MWLFIGIGYFYRELFLEMMDQFFLFYVLFIRILYSRLDINFVIGSLNNYLFFFIYYYIYRDQKFIF